MTKAHTLDEIERLMERDRFMNVDEALELGIIDKILEKRGGKKDENSIE
jgi:ATP-dependent Clp protease protease subunit